MKYFTKDWYNKMLCTSLYFGLKIDKRAEVFSEVFYQKLSKKEKKDFIKIHSFVMSYDKYKSIIQSTGLEVDEEKIRENFELIENPFQGMTIDEYFDYCQSLKKKELKEKLPKHILDKVKDIRVLALGYVSKDVYNLIKSYCDQNEKFYKDTYDKYNKLFEETFKKDEIEYLKHSFHDAYITEIKKEKRDITFLINNEEAFTNIESITFKNYNIVLDENVEKTYWLYDEIYKVDGGYEVHILTEYDDLREFIIQCEDIILK